MQDVSIIIPTYNRADLLKATVEKVLDQTYKNFQILIIDDNSTDHTIELLNSINDNRIKIIKRTINQGVCHSRIDGINASETELITFLDDDDSWTRNHIELMRNKIKTEKNIDMVLSDYMVSKNGTSSTIHTMEEFAKNLKKTIYKKPGPFFQCSMFKRKLLEKPEKLFDTKAIPSEDWDFFMNLSNKNPKVAYSSHIGFTWNFSNLSQSSNLNAEGNALEYITEKHCQDILKFCNRKVLGDHFRRVGRVFERAGNFQKAEENYRNAFCVHPKDFKNFWYRLLAAFNYSKSYRIANMLRKIRKTPLV